MFTILLEKRSTVDSLNQPINRMDIINDDSELHIYYGKTNAGNVTLDVDDTNGYGPETMTIKKCIKWYILCLLCL